jgi:hypothetical protein
VVIALVLFAAVGFSLKATKRGEMAHVPEALPPPDER